ncbi:MAG TPA: hypothetical protein DDZ80_22095 [Cyanobacteria bacterium UBA8803]|nr:hypothetical protein [Cyanobacteria bacterium UBA9273]HBL61023.1 hypothetical protein [Cyanobacteria bacterium UBA8803]
MDEVAIYNYSLNDCQIQNHYQIGTSGTEHSCVPKQAAVPEPASIWGIFALGTFGVGAIAKRKLHKKIHDDSLR